MVVGVCTEGEKGWEELWGYNMLGAKEQCIEWNSSSNTYEEDSEPYGYQFKPNDNVGVLLAFRGRLASLTFYKNSISCGEAFRIDWHSLQQKGKKLIPFVNIGGEAQIVLDSKALHPLDSYRDR